VAWCFSCRPAIEKILGFAPPKSSRQTVLFSATYPKNIKALADFACSPGHVLVDTIKEDDVQTAIKVCMACFPSSVVLQSA
jgi:superfamily II DNA/RNA helicase